MPAHERSDQALAEAAMAGKAASARQAWTADRIQGWWQGEAWPRGRKQLARADASAGRGARTKNPRISACVALKLGYEGRYSGCERVSSSPKRLHRHRPRRGQSTAQRALLSSLGLERQAGMPRKQTEILDACGASRPSSGTSVAAVRSRSAPAGGQAPGSVRPVRLPLCAVRLAVRPACL